MDKIDIFILSVLGVFAALAFGMIFAPEFSLNLGAIR